MKRFRIIILAMLASLSLAACNNDDGTATGSMTLKVTDAPVDNATAVVVEFTGVELKHQNGAPETIMFDTPRSIDLLALQGGDSEALLEDVEVEAGQYNWVRLLVNAESSTMNSYIALEDGSQHPLYIPSGAETGLKLVSGFIVPAGGESDFTIDFDLRKSVHKPEGVNSDYILRPALRIVDNAVVGSIGGTVANSLAGAGGCEPAVYVFSGADVTPDDVDEADDIDPLTSTQVTLDDASGEWTYTAAYLPPGDYTVSFTCEADLDDPVTEEDLAFTGTRNATVTAETKTTVNFN